MSPARHRVAFALGLAAALLTGVAMSGDPIAVKSGAVVLPISGLALDLPADPRADFTWGLSSSDALSDNGKVFDGRDVIDEKIKDELVAGTWVQVGYFDAGDCKATVGATALTGAWTEDRDFYGLRWCLRGGTFDLGADLGKVPAVAMCAHREGRKGTPHPPFLHRLAAGIRAREHHRRAGENNRDRARRPRLAAGRMGGRQTATATRGPQPGRRRACAHGQACEKRPGARPARRRLHLVGALT